MATVMPDNKKDDIPVAQAVAVQPVVPMAMAVPMQPVPAMHAPPTSLGTENFTKGIGYTPAVPAQQWRAPNLCDCGAAGGGICCAACCCPFITGPQLFEKVLGQKGSCQQYFTILLVFYLCYQIGSTMLRMTPMPVDEYGEVNIMYLVWNALSLFGWIGGAAVGAYVIGSVRRRVREKDQIGTACCGDAEDCCCSFWCSCCTTIQIFAHLDMRCDNGYELCSPEGVPTDGSVPGV